MRQIAENAPPNNAHQRTLERAAELRVRLYLAVINGAFDGAFLRKNWSY